MRSRCMPKSKIQPELNIPALAAEVDLRLRESSDAERKRFTEGYFPSAMENLGVAVPATRKLVAELKRRMKLATGSEAHALVRAIVGQNTLEGRNTAYLFLHAHPRGMATLNRKVIEELGRGIDNWTSVDTLGCYVAGVAWREGQLSDATLRAWAKSRDRWWRRLALVCTVALNLASRGGRGDPERTLMICKLLVRDHDDMVLKAMSWALRSLGVREPGVVQDFLDQNDDSLHRRVLREVVNKLEFGLKTPRLTARTGALRKQA
jgi:3-methyladenine DNA glycosylase AlkD